MSKMMEKDMSVMQGPSASRLQGWTLALAAAGVVSLGSVVQAEEAQNHVMTALSSTTLSGYIDTSASWRIGKNAGVIHGRTFDGADKQDGFNLNVVKLSIEKPLDEGEWSAGYKADLVFGPDANYYATLLNGGGANVDDFAVKQAYAALRVPVGNGIDVKMGVFDTLVGYEVFEAGNNPNSSRSYGYFLEPTHHTGVLASYQVSDMISLSAGIANTYTSPINGRAMYPAGMATQTQKAYMGSITITLPENLGVLAGSSIYAGVVDGLSGGNTKDTTSYYAGQTLNTPLEGLSVGVAFDYREDGAAAVAALQRADNWAWALAGYVSYQASEKLKLNARGDWTKGSDGTYYDAGAPGSNKANRLLSATLTADYSLWSGLITRLEGRWDHDLSGNNAFTGDDNVFTVALNAIYKF